MGLSSSKPRGQMGQPGQSPMGGPFQQPSLMGHPAPIFGQQSPMGQEPTMSPMGQQQPMAQPGMAQPSDTYQPNHPFNPTPALGQPNSFGQLPSTDLQSRWQGMNGFMKMLFLHMAGRRGITPQQALQNSIWFNQRQHPTPPMGG